ncbi:MAG TPA: class I SAM-dependent methyltransferase [Gemmatimonadaceae bacterium]
MLAPSWIPQAVRDATSHVELWADSARFRRERHPCVRALARAMEATRTGALTPAERRWVDEIERVRADALANTESLEITDYGARTGADQLSAEEMRQGTIIHRTIAEACRSSKPYIWSLLLFELVRAFKPALCLEMGTCVGISASYQAAALTLNGGGRLITLEGAPSLAGVARRHFARLGLDNATVVVGRFSDTLETVLREQGPAGLVFVDGHHDGDATLRYFEQIVPSLATPAVIVFDDVAWSPGMKRAWRAISADARMQVVVDLDLVGICVANTDISGKRRYRLSLM